MKVSGRTRDLVILVDKGAYHFTRHWVALFNVVLFLYVVPTFLAPYLVHAGYERAGRLIYGLYGPPVCHQLPERSFYLFGSKMDYSWAELVAAGMDPTQFSLERRYFLGTAELGYKIAVCQRDIAIYVGIFAFGFLYALLRRRWCINPLPWWGLVLLALPLAVDGLAQLVGLRESTPAARVFTGLCATAGGIGFVYPHIETAMADLRRDIARKLNRAA